MQLLSHRQRSTEESKDSNTRMNVFHLMLAASGCPGASLQLLRWDTFCGLVIGSHISSLIPFHRIKRRFASTLRMTDTRQNHCVGKL